LNIYNDPSWKPLLDLAEARTDIIRMRSAVRAESHRAWWDSVGDEGPRSEFFKTEVYEEEGRRTKRTTVGVAGRTLTTTTCGKPGQGSERVDMDTDRDSMTNG